MRDDIGPSVLSLMRKAESPLPAKPLRELAGRYKDNPRKLERLTEFAKMFEHTPIEASYTYPVISFRFACGITRVKKSDSETLSAEEFERAVYENKIESSAPATKNAEGVDSAKLWARGQVFKAALIGIFLGGATTLATRTLSHLEMACNKELISLVKKLEYWGIVIVGAAIACDLVNIALKEGSSIFKKNPPEN